MFGLNKKQVVDTFGVTSEHPLHNYFYKDWVLVRDCVAGERQIKSKGEVYCPRATGMSDSRYANYIRRARFVNYVGQTLTGVHGMIFRRAPVIDCPPEMDDILRNIDREGNSLYQFFSDATRDILQTGWGGFLLDYPSVSETLTTYEAEKRGIKPYVTYYKAESIINWKIEVKDGTKSPVLVVLKEDVEMPVTVNVFSHEIVSRYRVLKIDEDGIYRQYLYTPKIDEGKYVFDVQSIPVIINNKPLNYIPFLFAPSLNPDQSMLLNLAYVNIGHYMKSADYENGVHLTTLPTGYVTGEKPQTDKNGNIIPMILGQDNFLMFPNDKAKVGTLCFAGEGLTHSETSLEKAELQMVVLGSRIITPEKGVSETAESANIHRAGENAKLATFSRNMSAIATKMVNILADWCNIQGTYSVSFNTDYETMHFDANALNAMANIFSEGKMPLIVLYGMLMKGEFIPDPDMRYEDYIELLSLEHAGLSDKEVFEAYTKFKQDRNNPEIQALIDKAKPDNSLEVFNNVSNKFAPPKDEQDK